MPVLIAAGLIAAACYGLLCACSPFTTCTRCHGFGFRTTTDRHGRPKRGKTCRRCHGAGIRLRTGRRLFNTTRRTH